MAAARSRGRLADPIVETKPSSDAYVGLLAISLVAMVIGTVFLTLDYMQYEGKVPTAAKYSPPAPAATTTPPPDITK
ncbi:MAG TPA: hypothetical protein VGG61_12180 [Gemmataceae bacterium]|jgi:hypothetical protein